MGRHNIQLNSYDEQYQADNFTFVQADKKWILWSDGINGLYAWDSSTAAPYQVKDFVGYFNDNNGSGASNITYANLPAVPGLYYMVWFRGRLFGCNPVTSTVYYSGTRIDLATTEPVTREVRPWELWNLRMDLARYNPAYGGSMMVGDRSQRIVGMCSRQDGILVFKTNQILLWTYPDSAAPHEVEMGARIDELANGIGLVSHTSIAADGGTIYFLGKSNKGMIALYRIVGNTITNLSGDAIPDDLQDIIEYGMFRNKPIGYIYDNKYHLIADVGDGYRKLAFVYDILTGTWWRMDTPAVESVASYAGKMVFGGKDYGNVYMYPSEKVSDTLSGAPDTLVSWYLRTMQIDAGDPFTDKKFRELSYYIETIDTDGNPIPAEMDVDSTITYYDTTTGLTVDPQDPTTTTVTGSADVRVPLSRRAKSAFVELSGSTQQLFNLKQIRLGWREREAKR